MLGPIWYYTRGDSYVIVQRINWAGTCCTKYKNDLLETMTCSKYVVRMSGSETSRW
jgi:hypothetical protein